MRAAANHVIQSTGGELTKKAQRQLWDLQPSGINNWLIQPMNIHDEIMAPNKIPDKCAEVVNTFIQDHKSLVPLIGMSWKKDIPNWGAKK